MCHPFLLAGTVSSLLSQKILFEGIKLDCALTLMLEGKKSPNYTCTFLHPQKKKTVGQISWNWYNKTNSKRPPTQRSLRYFDRTGLSSPKLTHTIKSHSKIRALCQFSKRQKAEPVPAWNSEQTAHPVCGLRCTDLFSIHRNAMLRFIRTLVMSVILSFPKFFLLSSVNTNQDFYISHDTK